MMASSYGQNFTLICNILFTTGHRRFAECPKHSAKALFHSAKANRTRQKKWRRSHLCWVSFFGHSAKLCRVLVRSRQNKAQRRAQWRLMDTSPSAKWKTLSKGTGFAECQICGTRQTFKLCRVPLHLYSAKPGFLPSAKVKALGIYVISGSGWYKYFLKEIYTGERKGYLARIFSLYIVGIMVSIRHIVITDLEVTHAHSCYNNKFSGCLHALYLIWWGY